MKQTFRRIIKKIRNVNGNSLAEFATTTALMATLAATAAPKLSEMSENTKMEKSYNELDKLLTQARNFYQATTFSEGRGRFPGQEKYDVPVGGYGQIRGTQQHAIEAEQQLLYDLLSPDDAEGSFNTWDHQASVKWISVFGINNAAAPAPEGSSVSDDNIISCPQCYSEKPGHEEWLDLFAGNTLLSPYQDGHFIYVVIPGGGTGENVFPPVIYVADLESPFDINNVLEP